jgi:hypothetical protein
VKISEGLIWDLGTSSSKFCSTLPSVRVSDQRKESSPPLHDGAYT